MDKFNNEAIEKIQEFKSKHFASFGKFLIKVGLTANLLTFIALITGFVAVYYLMQNHLLFITFILVHILFDALDGLAARVEGSTLKGKYFDQISDSFIAFLLILKSAWLIGDLYIYLIGTLFALAMLIYFISKLRAPVYFMRTGVAIFYILVPYIPFTEIFYNAGAIFVGTVSAFILAKQLQWYLTRN